MSPARIVFSAFLLAMAVVPAAYAEECPIGLYRLANGTEVDIGAADGSALRWRMKDGTTGELSGDKSGTWTSTLGYTKKADGKIVTFTPCTDGGIRFAGMEGRRVAFDVTDTRFESDGVALAGRLVLPKGQGPVPIVVLVHGSEHDLARDTYQLQRLFPSEGIGVFVYDKRGTGQWAAITRRIITAWRPTLSRPFTRRAVWRARAAAGWDIRPEARADGSRRSPPRWRRWIS